MLCIESLEVLLIIFFLSLSTNKVPEKFVLKIVQNNKIFNCFVERDDDDNEFKIKINDTKFKIKDNLKLNEHIIRAKLNNEYVTMQLISKLANGEINLQYLGTKVIYKLESYKLIILINFFCFFFKVQIKRIYS